MDYKDYYKILGVAKDATPDDIKKAYRRLARKYHPDISKEPDAAARMAEVNEANTVLSDPEKRAAYDQLGDASQFQGGAGFQPPPGWDEGSFHFRSGGTDGMPGGGQAGDFSSFFEDLFGRGQQARRRGPPPDARGQDQHASIELTVPESYSGATRVLQLRGVELNAEGHAVETNRELHVTIPKGVYEGQMIRLAGKGQPGTGKGAAGDLLLQVHFAPDARWHAEGKDVYQQLPLTAWEAALGGPVKLDTLAGALEINVPAGSQPGRKLRVKGRGLPAREPGDLYLVVQLAVPAPVTEEQRAAYAALAKTFPNFNPRPGATA
ncbi:J domain-containing protein [Corticibacter populi]|uniref:J domain-containing protein n=1 Tax=Corticibacter populi TaxID=1550736 RepID=A0A3M6QM44_9BURK|nr:DnaJ C-terminal domain-containing protein [Corticibacter populi]RMX04158.1 J domain-containing protein [Corticibacter populi]RZS33177.1 curved DNA-binding protein [Corticibacter populi]